MRSNQFTGYQPQRLRERLRRQERQRELDELRQLELEVDLMREKLGVTDGTRRPSAPVNPSTRRLSAAPVSRRTPGSSDSRQLEFQSRRACTPGTPGCRPCTPHEARQMRGYLDYLARAQATLVY